MSFQDDLSDPNLMAREDETAEVLEREAANYRSAVERGAVMLGARWLQLCQVWAVCHDGQWRACSPAAVAYRSTVQDEVDAAMVANPQCGREAHAEWLRSGPFLRPLPHYLVNSDDEIVGIMQSLRAT